MIWANRNRYRKLWVIPVSITFICAVGACNSTPNSADNVGHVANISQTISPLVPAATESLTPTATESQSQAVSSDNSQGALDKSVPAAELMDSDTGKRSRPILNETSAAQGGVDAIIGSETHSLTDPTSIWVIVNKQNPIAADYQPDDLVEPNIPTGSSPLLRAEAAAALEDMAAAAFQATGQHLQMMSGYRSYDYQTNLYNNYVVKDGQQKADTYSARPGYSEHQTGLAADLTEIGGTLGGFVDSELGSWTAKNAWQYGFILRYTPENSEIVGYQSEPWHYRYVGQALADQYHQSGARALESIFNLPPAPNY